MKKIIIPFMAVLLITACGEDATGPEEGQGGEMTYSIEGYSFTWQQDPESADSLLVTIKAPTTGWVAVGFEPESFMNGANLIIGYFQSNTASMRDDYGTGQVTHDSDLNLGGTSDVRIISGSQSAGQTTLTFKIPYNSEDQYDKALAEGKEYTFIFAYGADDADDFTSTHVWAESASFEL